MNFTPNYIGRFAPSPTGPLHFGSLVAALASYLDAKANHGTWLVRMEDVDETRCQPEFADEILHTLTSFGLQWDGEVMVQSQRKLAYEQALARLFIGEPEMGNEKCHAYYCQCSRKEIADSVLTQTPLGVKGLLYPGTCRSRSGGIEHAKTLHAIRVLTHNQPISFSDQVQGKRSQQIESEIGDFIIKRRDGLFAYQFAVVVDDAAQGITNVVRGADLLDSTSRQIFLQQLMGFTTPRYLHIPVIANAAGQKLSKQTLAAAVSADSSPATINSILIQALTLLGQGTSLPDINMPISRLLQIAARQWRVEKIPAIYSISP